MSEIAAMPVQPLPSEYVGGHRAAEEAAAEASRSSWRGRIGQVAGRAALSLGLTIGAGVTMETANSTPVEAYSVKTIGACAGSWAQFFNQQTCVTGKMGEKDYENHREWVSDITVASPNAGPGFLEIWGDGFYKTKKDATDELWHIDKWVSSGTNICGAGTDKEGYREIACFHIDVE